MLGGLAIYQTSNYQNNSPISEVIVLLFQWIILSCQENNTIIINLVELYSDLVSYQLGSEYKYLN